MTPEQLALLQSVAQAAQTIGVVFVLLVAVWALYTRRVVPASELKEANARTEKAEQQRDEAIKGWREQSGATKEVADLVRDRLLDNATPRRRPRRPSSDTP